MLWKNSKRQGLMDGRGNVNTTRETVLGAKKTVMKNFMLMKMIVLVMKLKEILTTLTQKWTI